MKLDASRNPGEGLCPRTRYQLHTGDYVRGIGHTVVLKGRDDLFDPATGDSITTDDGRVLPGLQLFSKDEITAIPDNVGCCEICSVGELVTAVKPGDVVFIDFCDVRQGAIVADPETQKGGEVYIANDDAFKAYFDPATGAVTPMPGYAITKQATERFAIALNGTDRVHVPPMTLTTGIVSGRTSEGTPYAFVLYEEVAKVAAPAHESKVRPMTAAERDALDCMADSWSTPKEWDAAIDGLRKERRAVRMFDLSPGELVAFSSEFSVLIRVRGEFMRIVPQSALLCAIDDRRILDEAIRAGKAGQLVLP